MTKAVEDLDPAVDHIEHEGRRLVVLQVHTLPNHAEVETCSVVSGSGRLETVKFSRHEMVEVVR